jgi:hypothetical protein
LTTSKGDDLVVPIKTAIERDLDINMDPKLVPILEIELERPLCHKNVNIDANSIFQVAINRSEANAHHADRDGNFEGAGINVARELFVSLAKARQVSYYSAWRGYLDGPEAPFNGNSGVRRTWELGSTANGFDLFGCPLISARFGGIEGDEGTYQHETNISTHKSTRR